MRKKYVFKPYTELFDTLFLQEKARLLGVLGHDSLSIQHVGSTAVPGLGGKGIIDIALAVKQGDIENVSHKLAGLGYIFRESGSTEERSFFRIDLPDIEEEVRRYHLHVTFPESIEWKTLLAFRDYLRAHPEIVQEYAALKKKSADEANEDGALYRAKKSPFFQKTLLKALGHKIYFVIGASGSGKTTTLKQFENAMPHYCRLIHFDSIGVPPFEEMEKEYGSIEEWQKAKTFKWVEKLAKEDLLQSHVVFDAQIRPSFISEACDVYGVAYDVLLFDCSDEERKRRLVHRGHPELADDNMMNWAAFLRRECQHRCYEIINNTHLTLEQTFHLFSTWLGYQISTQIEIPVQLVESLIDTQFPEHSKLPINEVKPNGWDNRTFRLGREMSVRLPSAERYAAKVFLEHKYLPYLAIHLSLPIPKPIALGTPSAEYPWHWSIYGWIDGQTLDICHFGDEELDLLAGQLAYFLQELQAIDASDGPKPGSHNFYRGESPIVYDAETRSSIDNLYEYIDVKAALEVWERAIHSRWKKKPVWIHGDFSTGNILINEQELSGIIDFGGMAVGDPSCDLCIAWIFFQGNSRKIFKSALDLDEGTWNRARGWALWKALITLESNEDKTGKEAKLQLNLIREILEDI